MPGRMRCLLVELLARWTDFICNCYCLCFARRALPADVKGCEAEESIVCSGGHIRGQQGVALDDMVYVMTRMARQMEEVGHMESCHSWFGISQIGQGPQFGPAECM